MESILYGLGGDKHLAATLLERMKSIPGRGIISLFENARKLGIEVESEFDEAILNLLREHPLYALSHLSYRGSVGALKELDRSSPFSESELNVVRVNAICGSRFKVLESFDDEIFTDELNLEDSILCNNEAMIEYFLDKGAKLSERAMEFSLTSPFGVMRLLMNRGALNPNYVLSNMKTNEIRCIDELVERGAETIDDALIINSIAGNYIAVSHLLCKKRKNSLIEPLIAAVINDHIDVVKLLIEKEDLDLSYVMMRAIEYNNLEIVKYLSSRVEISQHMIFSSRIIARIRFNDDIYYHFTGERLDGIGIAFRL